MSFSFLDPVLGPFLQMNSLLAITILSLLISLIITLIYKYTTNQDLMKQLKDEIKEFQKELKSLKDNPAEMMRVQKEAMKTNMKYMSMSMKATLITFIPIIFIFGWMSSHFAFESIQPNEQFTVTVNFRDPVDSSISLIPAPGISVDGSLEKQVSADNVMWTLTGELGEHTLDIDYKGKSYPVNVIITQGPEYADPPKIEKGSDIKSIKIGYEKNIVLNLFGWKLGWLGTYIIFSIAFSLGLRKLMKVY